MKDKIIIIGAPGSGKSYEALRIATENTGTTIIANTVVGKSGYEKVFPALGEFEEKDGLTSFKIEKQKKYYISNRNRQNYFNVMERAKYSILGCDYGNLKEDKNALIVFGDSIWNAEKDKMQTLWQFSHSKCKIIIEIQSVTDIFNIQAAQLTDEMLSDIRKYWTIICCEEPGVTKEIKRLKDIPKLCI